MNVREGVEVFGPYAIEQTIGRGGMGVVYRARHVATEQRVALKTVRLRSAELFASFRREVHALAGLVHPGIVRVLDQGLTSGTPWYAMELVDGRTLASVIHRHISTIRPVVTETIRDGVEPVWDESPHRTSTLALREVYRLGRRICRALAFLHANGLVHRDLKPDNILIRPDGAPVLVDFGLVAQSGGGREVLDLVDPAAGTLAYMAPEQRMGRFVDARADLFSLGCVLYECASGALPFGPCGIHTMSAAPPPRLSAVAHGIPPELDALVMRLLARDPKDRFGYADDVEAILAQIDGEALSIRGQRCAYLYRPDLAGRDGVLHSLEQTLVDALCGQGRKVLVSGESGVGKTRLVVELAARAAEKGFVVITGDCLPVGAGGAQGGTLGAPLHAFRHFLLALADACRLGGEHVAQQLLGDGAHLLAAYEPAIPQSAHHATEALAPGVARATLLATLKAALLEYARDRPLLLVLDDLQWADDLSLELLASVTPADCATVPLALVGTYRAEEISAAITALAAQPGLHAEHLGRFDRDAVRRMVSGMLALNAPPEELIDFLHRDSGGNPFFVTEYLRAAIGERLLRRDDGHWTLDAAVQSADMRRRVGPPPTVTALVAKRLRDLDALTLRIAHAAAVLGRDFDVELVAKTADAEVAAVLDAYRTLSRCQILEEDASGSSRFVHDKLREIVYAQIEAAQLPHLHGRAANAIETLRQGRELEPHLAALGYHYARAGVVARAVACYERAGHHARRNYANRDAIRLYRLALEQLDTTGAEGERAEVRSRLLEAVGDLLLIVGDPVGARDVLSTALSAAVSAHDPLAHVRCRRKIAQTWERQHRHAEALADYARAEEALGQPSEGEPAGSPLWYEYLQIQVDKAWALYFCAKVRELSALVERVGPTIERHAAPVQRARFFQALTQNAMKRDRYVIGEATLEFTRASLDAAERCGDALELANARFFRGFVLSLRGMDSEADPLFRGALAVSERAGDATLHVRFLSYHTVVLRRLERVDEARATAEHALELADKGGMLDYVGVAHANLAWCAWRAARGDDAEDHANRALAAWDRLLPSYVYPLQWLARMPLAARLHSVGHIDDALAQLRALVIEPQQILPRDLADAIDAALAATDGPHMAAVLEVARAHRFV